jgi:hypothetical protein
MSEKSDIGGVQRGITPSGGGLGASPSYKFILFSLGEGEAYFG